MLTYNIVGVSSSFGILGASVIRHLWALAMLEPSDSMMHFRTSRVWILWLIVNGLNIV